MGLLSWLRKREKSDFVLYSSEVCSDCQLAEDFFKDNNIEIEIKKIEDPEIRKELKEKYDKVLVPTIILGKEKYIGFEQNKKEIMKRLNMNI
ncbi:MAG: glutaredoxin family protein [Halanaerobiales bacterium]